GPDEFASRRFVAGSEVVPLGMARKDGAAARAREIDQAIEFRLVAGPGSKHLADPNEKAVHLRVHLRHATAIDHADDDALRLFIGRNKLALADLLEIIAKMREHRVPSLAFCRDRPMNGHPGERPGAGAQLADVSAGWRQGWSCGAVI